MIEPAKPQTSRPHHHIASWRSAEEAARVAERALGIAREKLRIARERSVDRRRHAEDALAAGQEAFVEALQQAAEAHDAIAREVEGCLPALERQRQELRRIADVWHVDIHGAGAIPLLEHECLGCLSSEMA